MAQIGVFLKRYMCRFRRHVGPAVTGRRTEVITGTFGGSNTIEFQFAKNDPCYNHRRYMEAESRSFHFIDWVASMPTARVREGSKAVLNDSV